MTNIEATADLKRGDKVYGRLSDDLPYLGTFLYTTMRAGEITVVVSWDAGLGATFIEGVPPEKVNRIVGSEEE